jgi:membrane protease YdiL (CAAX protease family)
MTLPAAVQTAGARPRGPAWLSAAEFFAGAAIVIGHNVFHVVPNEVPILFVLGLLSFHLRDGGWKNIGLTRPKSWKLTVGLAVAAAAVRLGLGALIEAVGNRYWPAIKAPEGSESIAGDWKQALLWLGLVWTFAAFGEEISYRGYLMTRAADLGRRSTAAYWAAAVVTAILFGYGHYYKGPIGIVDSGVAGLILAAVYLLSGRNLWASILAHGLIDTVGVVALFFGWAS